MTTKRTRAPVSAHLLSQPLDPARPLVRPDRSEYGNRRHAIIGNDYADQRRHGASRATRLAATLSWRTLAGKRVGNNLRRKPGKVAAEHVGRPPRRSDQERRPPQEPIVFGPPLRDVDGRELRLAGEALATRGEIGFPPTVPSIGTQQCNRRAGETEVVDRVAEGQPESVQRLQQSGPATEDVVEVQQIDAERCAQTADEMSPALVGLPAKIEESNAAIRVMLLDSPGIARRYRQVVALVHAKAADERADMALRSAAVAMDNVQDPLPIASRHPPPRKCRIADGAQGVGLDVGAYHRVVVRVPLQQQRQVPLPQLRLASD